MLLSKSILHDFTIDNFRYDSPLLVHWENIELNNNTLKYTEYYTHKIGLHCRGMELGFPQKQTALIAKLLPANIDMIFLIMVRGMTRISICPTGQAGIG